MVLRILKMALRLRVWHGFYAAITENFEHFEYFNFETDFLENEKLF